MGMYQFPESGAGIHWKKNENNYLWIILDTKKINEQQTKLVYLKGGTESASIGETFKFLAPMEISETINHSWEPYESIESRISQMLAKEQKGYKEGAQVLQSITESKSLLNTNIGAVDSVRIDSPLQYKNSMRREYTFTFELMANTSKTSILNVVKKLESFSCPEFLGFDNNKGTSFAIEMPYVFSVRTEPSGIINMRNSVLLAVQPTYIGPFHNGKEPTKCNLTLTFKEYEPLYRHIINDEVTINVGE